MRNLLLHLLLSAPAVALVACSDGQPTAPRSTPARAAGALVEAAQTVNPSAKPQDQVGFTHVVMALSQVTPINAGLYTGQQAKCPAGTVATGGGYEVSYPDNATIPSIARNSPLTDLSGWLVLIDNRQPGTGVVNLLVYVNCIS